MLEGPRSTRPKLLVVEDDEKIRTMIRRTFGDDYAVHEAADGAEALVTARTVKPDVIITDQRMPEMTGVEFLSTIKEELPNAIRVLITGYTDYGPLVDALNAASVHHYFEKPFHTVDLRTTVDVLHRSAELERQRDLLLERLQNSVDQLQGSNTELREKEVDLSSMVNQRTRELTEANAELIEANRRLKELAVRDGLTGLFNHRCLIEHIELEVARSKRYGRQFTLLFMDIDHFKRINDQYGHAVGDTVLVRIADLLLPSLDGLRHSDFAARYGGEEFCIILPETHLEGGCIKAERLRQAIEKLTWNDMQPPLEGPITMSIGVASFPEHGHSVNTILEAADAALYRAKNGGRNQVASAE
jgi:diguanylate cyclase (GGDEF)-like protein